MFFDKKHKLGYRPTGILALEINYAMVAMALQMVVGMGVVFVYLLGSGFYSGLGLVMGFYGLQRLVALAVSPLMGRLVFKFGYRRAIMMAMMMVIVKLLLFSVTDGGRLWILLPALIAGGIYLSLYDTAFNGMFLDDNDNDRLGEQSGLLNMLASLGGVLAPLTAGLLVKYWGFGNLFLLVAGLLLVSTVPLWLMPHHQKKLRHFAVSDSATIFRREKKLVWSVFWLHFQDSVMIFFWPVYLYLLVTDFPTFGLFGSLALAASGVANFIAGKMYDRKMTREKHGWFAVLVGAATVLMVTVSSSWWAAMAYAGKRLVGPFWWMKIRREALVVGEEVPAVEFGVVWVWITSLGYITGLLVTGGLVLVIGRWQLMALPALLGVIASTLVINGKGENVKIG